MYGFIPVFFSLVALLTSAFPSPAAADSADLLQPFKAAKATFEADINGFLKNINICNVPILTPRMAKRIGNRTDKQSALSLLDQHELDVSKHVEEGSAKIAETGCADKERLSSMVAEVQANLAGDLENFGKALDQVKGEKDRMLLILNSRKNVEQDKSSVDSNVITACDSAIHVVNGFDDMKSNQNLHNSLLKLQEEISGFGHKVCSAGKAAARQESVRMADLPTAVGIAL
jgi:hypothetical protein